MKTRPQALLALASACALSLLAGCGIGNLDPSASGALNLTGNVHGGQQAVVGARIFLYDAGKSGNGSAATDLLAASGHTVITGKFGAFGLTGDYTCPNANDQLYIAAVGGDPGIGSSNSSITLVTALGSCGTLLANANTTFITINEVTTAAAAWSLGAFAQSATAVGASATNLQGMTNAMKNAALLANPTTGVAASTTGQTIETGKLYALADALATCVNSTGSACSGLFSAATPPSGTAPTDTFTAALNIVHYPGRNVAAVYNQIGSTPPFATTLTAAPNDWTMSDTIALPSSGGKGGVAPNQLAIDGTGTVWTVDAYNAVLDAVTPQGAVLGQYGAGALTTAVGVTVNAAGNVWVSSENASPDGTAPNGYLSKFQSTTGSAPGTIYSTGVNGTPYFYDANTTGPAYLASDSNGNIVAVDFFGGAYTEVVTDAGAFTSTMYGLGPFNAVFDTNHGLWIPDLGNTGDVLHLVGGIGGTATDVACCQTTGGLGNSYAEGAGLGLDVAGNLWITSVDTSGNGTGYISAVSNSNAVLINSAADGISSAAVTGDAGGVVWFANAINNTIAGISSGAGTGLGAQPIGTSLSTTGGFGKDAGIGGALWIAPDASGNLWLSDADNGTLLLFFGMATPTATPELAVPTAP